jgi:hypothetical protein
MTASFSAVLPPVVGLALAVCPDARALGPLDVEVGARGGMASNPIGGGFPNPLGAGAGARAGVSVLGFYAGVTAEYYFGQGGQSGRSGPITPPPPPMSVTIIYGSMSVQSLLLGGELGFGVKLGRFVLLRAQLGFGDDMIIATGEVYESFCCVTAPLVFYRPVYNDNAFYFYLEPGITALAEFNWLYAGVDVGALLLPSGPIVGISGPNSPFSSAHKLDDGG